MSENRRRGAREAGRRALMKGLFGAALLPPIDPVLSRLAWPDPLTSQAPAAEATSPVRALRSHRGQRRRRRGAPRRLHLRRRPEVGRRVHRLRAHVRLQQRLHRRLRPRRARGSAARRQPRVRQPRLRGRRRAVSADLRDAARPPAHRRRLQDRRRGVGGARAARRRERGLGAGAGRSAEPPDRRATRRADYDGPASPLIGQEAIEGTFDNCSGQVTPWGTALSCEENFQARVPELVDAKGRSVRGGSFDLPGGHYGWVVEVDPFDPGSTPSSTPRSAASATRTSGCARKRASRWPDTWATTAFAATCGSSSPTACTARATTRATGCSSPRARSTPRGSIPTAPASGGR